MTFVKNLIAALIIAALAGCAAPVMVGFGPSAKNPNSFGMIRFQGQHVPTLTVSEKEPDGVTRQFVYSCQRGGALGYDWLKDDEGKPVRRFSCKSNGDSYAANRSLLVNNANGYGNNYGSSGGRCVPAPQVYGQYNQPQCWPNPQ